MNFFNFFFWLVPFLTFEFSALCGIVLSVRLFCFRRRKARREESGGAK